MLTLPAESPSNGAVSVRLSVPSIDSSSSDVQLVAAVWARAADIDQYLSPAPER